VIRFGPIGLPPIVGSSNAALLVVSGETWAKVPGRFAEGLQDHRRRSSGLSPKVVGTIAEGRRDPHRCSWGWSVRDGKEIRRQDGLRLLVG
jgi:hypothetical protein